MDETKREKLDRLEELDTSARELFLNEHYEEAIEVFKHALDMKKELLGNEHPNFLASVDFLVGIFEKLQRKDSATALTIWALSNSGWEPFSIFKLKDCGESQRLEYLQEIIAGEVREAAKEKKQYLC